MAQKSENKRKPAKHKIDRRLGVNLWGRPKSPVNIRSYAPGEHGQRRKKPSDYGVQLMAKQKLKGYYGNIGEKQFRKYFKEAVRRRGDTGQNLIGILESRLDSLVYRLKFAPTVFAARQLVNHGHIHLNGKRCNISSAMMKIGDEIELKEKSHQIPMVIEAINSQERDVPEYCEADHKKMKGSLTRIPQLEDVPYPTQMEPNLVVEYYSR